MDRRWERGAQTRTEVAPVFLWNFSNAAVRGRASFPPVVSLAQLYLMTTTFRVDACARKAGQEEARFRSTGLI